MAAATRLDFILVVCFESIKYESHLNSLRWVLLPPEYASAGFSLLTAFLNVASKDVQSLSFNRPWKREIQKDRIDVQDTYTREPIHAESPPLHLLGHWNLHFIQQSDDISNPVGQYYGGQFHPSPYVGFRHLVTRRPQHNRPGFFGRQQLDLKKIADVQA